MRILVTPPLIPDDLAVLPQAALPGTQSGARLWLVRHAEVHADWQQKAYGGLDVPLSADGELQTARLAQSFAHVKATQIVSSSLSRALHMGRAISVATQAPLAIDENLREVSRGEWQGLPIEDFRARWEAQRDHFLADPWNWKGHKGESDAEVFARGWSAIETHLTQVGDGTLVVTSHYNLIRSVATRLLGLSPAQSFAFRTDTAHAALFKDGARGWELVAANVDDPASVREST